jgi:hypothetical protein
MDLRNGQLEMEMPLLDETSAGKNKPVRFAMLTTRMLDALTRLGKEMD